MRGGFHIQGIVTDPEFIPVQGAQVEIGADDGSLTILARVATDEQGAFRFEGLAEGSYYLTARKDGYRDAPARQARIEADSLESVSLVLEPLAAAEPYHLSLGGRTLWQEIVCVFAPTLPPRCTTGNNLANLSKRFFVNEPETGPLMTVLAEAMWTPTVSACNPVYRLDVFVPGAKVPTYSGPITFNLGPHQWSTAPNQKTSPLYLMVPRDGEDGITSPARTAANDGIPLPLNGNWTMRHWYEPVGATGLPLDVMCAVNQTVDNWMTVFFYEAAPAGWSFFKT